MKYFAMKIADKSMKMKPFTHPECPQTIVRNDFSYQGASVVYWRVCILHRDLVRALVMSYRRLQDMRNLLSSCCLWHINFPEQTKGNVFTSASMVDQITLMTVVDQITLATTYCSPVWKRGFQKTGKASLAEVWKMLWVRYQEAEALGGKKQMGLLFPSQLSSLSVPAKSWNRERNVSQELRWVNKERKKTKDLVWSKKPFNFCWWWKIPSAQEDTYRNTYFVCICLSCCLHRKYIQNNWLQLSELIIHITLSRTRQ